MSLSLLLWRRQRHPSKQRPPNQHPRNSLRQPVSCRSSDCLECYSAGSLWRPWWSERESPDSNRIEERVFGTALIRGGVKSKHNGDGPGRLPAQPFPALLRMTTPHLRHVWQFVGTASHLNSVHQNMFNLVCSFDPAEPDSHRTAFNSDQARALLPESTRCFTQTTEVHCETQISYRLTCKKLS